MNRRSFLGRVSAAAAVVPALSLVKGDNSSPHSAPGLVPGDAIEIPLQYVKNPDPQAPPDLFQLRLQRGLVKPCPGCSQVAWRRNGHGTLTCQKCDWTDLAQLLVLDCRCADCARPDGEAPSSRGAVELHRLLRDAPVGLYRVTERGQVIERTVRSDYDPLADRFLHDVRQQQVARVSCAVREAIHRREVFNVETYRQPGGNIVRLAWDPVDWLEKHQDEGQA